MKKLSFLTILFSFLIFQPLTVSATSYDQTVQKGIDKTQKEISDTTITTKVKTKLLADSRTQGMSIKVSTSSNVVTLTGKVKNEAEKQAAEELTTNTDGVKSVNNQLEIE